jgi:hypothetical protein
MYKKKKLEIHKKLRNVVNKFRSLKQKTIKQRSAGINDLDKRVSILEKLGTKNLLEDAWLSYQQQVELGSLQF